jgi:lysyl-tRNA synthetase class 2
MRLIIDERIFERFPGLNLGLVVARGVDNQGESREVLELIQDRQKEIAGRYDSETISLEPRIQAWRQAYSAFGAKPKKYKSSVESLYRMALKGMAWSHINKIVDIYNYISLEHMVPLGGDDLEQVSGDIVLTFAQGEEVFTPLNSEVQEPVKPGEVIYRDDSDVLCRRWNWRESDKTKMTADTHDVLMVLEGLPPVTREDVDRVLVELADLVDKFCGGRIQTHILDSQSPQLWLRED